MPELSVRGIDESVLRNLKLRAEEHGVSMEEFARQVLRRAVMPPQRLGSFALECFGPENGLELQLPSHESHDAIQIPE